MTVITRQFHWLQTNKLPCSIGYIMLHPAGMSREKLNSQNLNQRFLLALIQRNLLSKRWVKVMENAQKDKAIILIKTTIPLLNMAITAHSGCSQNFNRFERWQLQKIISSLDLARKQASRSNQEAHPNRKTKTLQGVSDRTDMAPLIVTYSTIWMRTRTALRFYNSRIIERKFQILQIKMELLKTVRWGFLSVHKKRAWTKATMGRRS